MSRNRPGPVLRDLTGGVPARLREFGYFPAQGRPFVRLSQGAAAVVDNTLALTPKVPARQTYPSSNLLSRCATLPDYF